MPWSTMMSLCHGETPSANPLNFLLGERSRSANCSHMQQAHLKYEIRCRNAYMSMTKLRWPGHRTAYFLLPTSATRKDDRLGATRNGLGMSASPTLPELAEFQVAPPSFLPADAYVAGFRSRSEESL